MRAWMGGLRRSGAVAAVVALGTQGAAAQERLAVPSPSLGLTGGAFAYDIGGDDGTSGFVGVQLRLPLGDYLAITTGLEYASYDGFFREEGEPDVPFDAPFLMADVELTAGYQLGRFRPFVGGGTGGLMDRREERDGRKFVELSYSGVVGVRVDVAGPVEVVAQGRYRDIGSLGEQVIQAMAGVFFRF